MWEYKKTNFKAEGLQVYGAYLFGEFSHYCYRTPVYQLRTFKTLKGTTYKEVKLKGIHQYQYFFRWKNEQGLQITWEQWKNEIRKAN